MINKRYPRDPSKIASPSEKDAAFLRWVDKADEETRRRKAAEVVLKDRTTQARTSQREAKIARGEVVTLSRKQKAKEEATKAGYWSGGAAICVALFYEFCKASDGWIGGPKYQSLWQHEAMISTLTFLTTSVFAWVYKAAHPDSK
jgi:hypothetical protein